MENKKLILAPKKYKAETTTIVSARIPTKLMEKIEDLAAKTNRNRNEILQILLEYATENVVVEESK